MKRPSNENIKSHGESPEQGQDIAPVKRKKIQLLKEESKIEMTDNFMNIDPMAYPHWPDLTIADRHFQCVRDPSNAEIRNDLIVAIQENLMSSLYTDCCERIPGWHLDEEILSQMHTETEAKLVELDANMKDADENFGAAEIRTATMAKLQFLCRTGKFTEAIELIKQSAPKKAMATLSSKLDLKFFHIRCLLFDLKNVHELCDLVAEARIILEESGAADWDRKNRLKLNLISRRRRLLSTFLGFSTVSFPHSREMVIFSQLAYEALVAFHVKRDYATATRLFLEILPTYNCYEILDHKTFISYTVLFGMISLERPDLRDKIVKNSEIRQVLFSDPDTRQFLTSLFECRYADFFKSLSCIEQLLKRTRIWYPHYRHYTNELKLLAYKQHIESYSSLSIRSMADAFGVTQDMIGNQKISNGTAVKDNDLSRLIANGRLNCKIDKVMGHVNDFRLDEKNSQYHELIKKGDVLLTRIQKLSRVISL